jgi:hypothetical protein
MMSLIKNIGQDKAFRFCDGNVAYSISDLSPLLEKISDETFRYHVNQNKNDLANWIEFVFEEKNLANDLRLCHDRNEAVNILDIALHGEISKMQEKKENHNRESHITQEKEQLELKERLELLKNHLKAKINENCAEKSDSLLLSSSTEIKEIEYKPKKNLFRDYIILWLISSFIFGAVIGIILSRIIV